VVKEEQGRPPASFQAAREVLRSYLDDLAAGSVRLEPAILTYRVAGGPPGKRLETVLEVTSTGQVSLEHLDELSRQRRRRTAVRIPVDEVTALFRRVRESRLLEQTDAGGGFLPDSIVGSITIAASGARVTYYFLADERQRGWQSKEISPAIATIKAALDALTDRMRGRTPRSRR
jgi:hypothetical protein